MNMSTGDTRLLGEGDLGFDVAHTYLLCNPCFTLGAIFALECTRHCIAYRNRKTQHNLAFIRASYY
jgi:hypothetical protein